MANSQYGLAPNYQLPIQKSSALLPCQMLVKDMANILATHIWPEHMASINDTLGNRKKEVGGNGPEHRYQPPCEVLLAEKMARGRSQQDWNINL